MSLSWIEISKSALLHNIGFYRELIGKAKLMSVVKSNAYGHGIELVSEIINDQTDWFGTASAEEAILLRDQGINKSILVLSFYDDDLIEELLRKNISLAVYDRSQFKRLDAAARKLKTKARIHLKVDTGTSRLGFYPEDVPAVIEEIKKFSGLICEGLFSHLAASEDLPEYTNQQLEKFNTLVVKLSEQGINIPIKHIACSAAAQGYADSCWDLIRLGIGLYGLSSYKTKGKPNPKVDLRPVLSWKTRLVQVKNVPKNTFVGYGCTYKTTKASVLGILPVGYYDGFDRKLSNNGEVLINGERCPVRGRVCMNLIIVDLSRAKSAKVGDEAVLIGEQGDDKITADELAKKVGTINYEIVTRLNSAIPRVVVS